MTSAPRKAKVGRPPNLTFAEQARANELRAEIKLFTSQKLHASAQTCRRKLHNLLKGIGLDE